MFPFTRSPKKRKALLSESQMKQKGRNLAHRIDSWMKMFRAIATVVIACVILITILTLGVYLAYSYVKVGKLEPLEDAFRYLIGAVGGAVLILFAEHGLKKD